MARAGDGEANAARSRRGGTFKEGTVGHFGSDVGGASLAGCVPEQGVVFAVLFNSDQSVGSADSLIQAMVSP
jgi:hypothetical protein